MSDGRAEYLLSELTKDELVGLIRRVEQTGISFRPDATRLQLSNYLRMACERRGIALHVVVHKHLPPPGSILKTTNGHASYSGMHRHDPTWYAKVISHIDHKQFKIRFLDSNGQLEKPAKYFKVNAYFTKSNGMLVYQGATTQGRRDYDNGRQTIFTVHSS